MKIGIISDTHDNLPNLRRALAILKERGVALVLHAGDFVSPFVAEPFREAGLQVLGVFGNNDGDRLQLQERFRTLGELHVGPHEFDLAGRKIVLMHEPRALEALVNARRYDLVIYGHTHRAMMQSGPPLVVNPGELGAWLTGRATFALVDLMALRGELLEL